MSNTQACVFTRRNEQSHAKRKFKERKRTNTTEKRDVLPRRSARYVTYPAIYRLRRYFLLQNKMTSRDGWRESWPSLQFQSNCIHSLKSLDLHVRPFTYKTYLCYVRLRHIHQVSINVDVVYVLKQKFSEEVRFVWLSVSYCSVFAG